MSEHAWEKCKTCGLDCPTEQPHICSIHTEHVYPPILIRCFDWLAYHGDYDLGCLVGYGATEAEAVADLQQQMEDDEGPVDKLSKAEHTGPRQKD